jgi:phosphoribosylformimino-5-aminoimidazole carboxamide ribotide isomerase
MEVIPSIDLRGGWVVKLTGGKKSTEWRISDDPVSIARRWRQQGARRIHMVDLDAAFGEGGNREAMRSILKAFPSVKLQVSGGIRSSELIETWLRRGASRVIVGTRAIEDRAWLALAAREFRSKLWVAVDSLGDRIVIRGWTRPSGISLKEYVAHVDGWPFGGYLYTDVRVEGRHAGFDREAVRRMVELTRKPVLYSGGVSRLEDLRRLGRLGARGAVVGAALYRETFTLKQAMEAAR